VSRAGVAEGRWRIKDDILCSVSWEDTTHGGDRFTVQGDAMVSQIAPEANGGFVALGYGQGTVTYHPVNGCRVTNGDTFTAQYVVTVESDDGRSARVDIGSSDQPHTFSVVCPGLLEGRGVSKRPQATADFDPPGLPTVTVELHEGATPFSNDRPVRTVAGLQRVGDEGTVTLRYCTPEQSNGQ
jgi:hypothetical protein